MFGLYRDTGQETAADMVTLQMTESCEFLYKWRKYSPAIAGGALWSWAAGVEARDVDFFMKSTWSSRRNFNKLSLGSESGKLFCEKSDSYNTWFSEKTTKRYLTGLTLSKTIADVNLTPWTGVDAALYFDYRHCMVAFGPDGFLGIGALHYSIAKAEKVHNQARSVDLILSKVQKSLWGNVNAEKALNNTMISLANIYRKVSAQTK